MESLIRWWVRNPVAANLLMLIIVTAGWLGLRDIEKEVIPSVQPDIIQVEIMWPGASPKEVELLVVQRVEEALQCVHMVCALQPEPSQHVKIHCTFHCILVCAWSVHFSRNLAST